jgi:hypothetical protein
MTTIGKNGTTQFNSFVDGLHKQGAITKQQMAVLKDGTVTNADRKIAKSLDQEGKVFEAIALREGLSRTPESKGKPMFEERLGLSMAYGAQGAAHAIENFTKRLQSELHDAGVKVVRNIK